MSKKEGYDFAKENGYIPDYGDFYRLFKNITRLKTLTSSEKIILAVVMSYTANGQEFFMSNNRLALETGMDYTSAIRCITSMKEKGFVKTFKVIDKKKNLIIGRTAVPQKQFMADELARTFNEFEYEEY